MPPRTAPPKGYRCSTCGEVLGSFGALGVHKQAHKREGQQGPAAPKVRRHRIEEVVPGAVDPGIPSPDLDVSAAAEPLARPSRPTVASPSIRISPEQRAQSVADAVRDALPISTLADMLQALSRSISEMDGAGEAGVLSPIQSVQVASLLYDATVDLVVDRFGGDVTRFKAGLAVLIVLIAKGRVHAVAISARISERRAIAKGKATAQAVLQATEGDEAPLDVFEAARRREAMLRAQGIGAEG